MRYFSSQTVAEGYAKHRPYFHPIVIQKIKAHLNIERNLKRALDVGCGAGLSTRALTALADRVVGIDHSSAMINAAVQQHNVRYYPYPAENIPFRNGSFEMITVCGALNWINRGQFFAEARRLLTPHGWIIIYDNFIQGVMKEKPAFERWYAGEFLRRYPKPPRDERPLAPAECQSYGFHFVHQETYTNDVTFSQEQCIAYLMTQSNITAAVNRDSDADAIQQWLAETLAPLFGSSPKTLQFGGFIWYLQREES